MKISVITLFPEVFTPIINSSILGRAQKKGKVTIELINLRDFGEGTAKTVDDRPYGGGAGMIIKPTVLLSALKSIVGLNYFSKNNKLKIKNLKFKIIVTSASGESYKQKTARQLSSYDHLVIICGHYEGIDQRFIDKFVDLELSIGDFVLTGGEIPAMAIVDSVIRLIPGVLEKEDATLNESFENDLLEHPHYTRPEDFLGEKVPDVLLSGNHKEIEKWRAEKSLEKTKKIRPDLLKDSKNNF